MFGLGGFLFGLVELLFYFGDFGALIGCLFFGLGELMRDVFIFLAQLVRLVLLFFQLFFQSVIFLGEGLFSGLEFLFKGLLFGGEFLESLLGSFEGIFERRIFLCEVLNDSFEGGLNGVV